MNQVNQMNQILKKKYWIKGLHLFIQIYSSRSPSKETEETKLSLPQVTQPEIPLLPTDSPQVITNVPPTERNSPPTSVSSLNNTNPLQSQILQQPGSRSVLSSLLYDTTSDENSEIVSNLR